MEQGYELVLREYSIATAERQVGETLKVLQQGDKRQGDAMGVRASPLAQ